MRCYLPWLVWRGATDWALVGFVGDRWSCSASSALLGAGLQSHFDYLVGGPRRRAPAGVTDISVPGILINAGLDPSIAQLAIPLIVGIWADRGHVAGATTPR